MKVSGDGIGNVPENASGGGEVDGGGEGGRMVVVGVRLDQQSKELLTWALVNAAEPGDRVVALHFLHESTEEQSTLLSLVKTFDSVLAVYEGFCHLKQVDLKLKVCRGPSLRKILVREAKEYGAATVVLGASKTRHTIRSASSVAKYCARKLPHNFSIFAIDNGKIVFQRKPTSSAAGNVCKRRPSSISSTTNEKSDRETHDSLIKHRSSARRSALLKRYLGCAPTSVWADYSRYDLAQESDDDDRKDTSLALVPYQTPEASLRPTIIMDRELNEFKQGWPLIRRVFLPKQQHPGKASTRKTSVVRCILKLPTGHSHMAVHPDEKRGSSPRKEEESTDLNGEHGAVVVVGNDETPCSASPIHRSRSLPKELEGLHEKYLSTCRLFTYQELLSATSDFQPEKMVGRGGSSQVYRGCLPDGKELAVKILKPSEDAMKEFIAEIEIITTISHKNIVSLFGYCFEDDNLILVYDFLSRGSLEENLHGNKKDASAFRWEERYKVAVGVAEALDYLHNRNSQTVIHRDVKSSNILLSDDFEPQLADFGLAAWTSSASSVSICADVAGTFGYLAPEYFMHGKVTEKIDVYAFGVVLLELLSGRKPIDNKNPKGQESLVMWANSVLKDGKMTELLDASLGSDYDHDQIERMVLAATLCIKRAPRLRPRISLVLKLLQGDIEVINWAKQQANTSSTDFDAIDGDSSPTDIQSHLNIAFLDIGDDSASVSSTEQNISFEDYLKGRWSRTSSFD